LLKIQLPKIEESAAIIMDSRKQIESRNSNLDKTRKSVVSDKSPFKPFSRRDRNSTSSDHSGTG